PRRPARLRGTGWCLIERSLLGKDGSGRTRRTGSKHIYIYMNTDIWIRRVRGLPRGRGRVSIQFRPRRNPPPAFLPAIGALGSGRSPTSFFDVGLDDAGADGAASVLAGAVPVSEQPTARADTARTPAATIPHLLRNMVAPPKRGRRRTAARRPTQTGS